MDSSELGVVREYFSFRVEVGPWVSTFRGLMLSHLGSGWVGQIKGKAEGLHQMLQVTIQWQEETVLPRVWWQLPQSAHNLGYSLGL